MHKSVRGIVKKEDGIILIHRIKKLDTGKIRDYYVFPGGKMEKDESELQTLEREIFEELGIKVEVERKLIEYDSEYDDSIQMFYICKYKSGNFQDANGPEYTDEKNYKGVFEPVIVKLDDFKKFNIVPEEIKLLVQDEVFDEKKL